jgi:hypothetical protein
MTTNVFDGNKAVMATDSRWSWRWGNYLLYLDDTGSEKIVLVERAAVMFAGKGNLIQAWKDFLWSKPTSWNDAPKELKGLSVCVVSVDTKSVLHAVGDYHAVGNSGFAGTGRNFARTCWTQNGDACKSVRTAIAADHYSGGPVNYFDIGNNKHNLVYQAKITIDMVNAALSTRGQVMSINDSNFGPVPFAKAASADAGLKEFGDRVASGQVSPEAPFDGMTREWTKEETDGFQAALTQVFGWK